MENEQLNNQISNLQSQIDNLTQIATLKEDEITQLNSEISALNIEFEVANHKITNLNNELYEAQRYIRILQEGIAEGPIVIYK